VLAEQRQLKKRRNQKLGERIRFARSRAVTGQIRSRAAVDTLIAVLGNEDYAGDIRREAAIALGLIGDSAAVPALRAAQASDDPYLSEARMKPCDVLTGPRR